MYPIILETNQMKFILEIVCENNSIVLYVIVYIKYVIVKVFDTQK